MREDLEQTAELLTAVLDRSHEARLENRLPLSQAEALHDARVAGRLETIGDVLWAAKHSKLTTVESMVRALAPYTAR